MPHSKQEFPWSAGEQRARKHRLGQRVARRKKSRELPSPGPDGGNMAETVVEGLGEETENVEEIPSTSAEEASSTAPHSKEENATFFAEYNRNDPVYRTCSLMAKWGNDTQIDDEEDALDDVRPDPCPGEETYSEIERRKIVVEDGRFEVIKKTGAGTYGVVFKVRDTKTDELSALKVLRSRWCEEQACAVMEYKFGRRLAEAEEEAGVESRVVRYLKSGQEKPGLLSLGAELLPALQMELLEGPSLWDFITGEDYQPWRPFHWQTMYHIVKHICEGVQFLHAYGTAHTDLKSENVVFTHKPKYVDVEDPIAPSFKKNVRPSILKVRMLENPSVKIIDLGNAYDATEKNFGKKKVLINSRPYRGPEVMLRKGWDFKSDIWSLGVTLYELYTGHRMFDVDLGAYQQFRDMEARLGQMPSSLLRLGEPEKVKEETFREDDNFDAPNPKLLVVCQNRKKIWRPTIRYSKRLGGRQTMSADCVEDSPVKPLERAMRKGAGERPTPITTEFFSLLRAMLQYDPEKRVTAHEVLQHKFFAVGKEAYENWLRDVSLPYP